MGTTARRTVWADWLVAVWNLDWSVQGNARFQNPIASKRALAIMRASTSIPGDTGVFRE
jgi:hypothetical protein